MAMTPATVPRATAPLPAEPTEPDLEEGEVLSPVQAVHPLQPLLPPRPPWEMRKERVIEPRIERGPERLSFNTRRRGSRQDLPFGASRGRGGSSSPQKRGRSRTPPHLGPRYSGEGMSIKHSRSNSPASVNGYHSRSTSPRKRPREQVLEEIKVTWDAVQESGTTQTIPSPTVATPSAERPIDIKVEDPPLQRPPTPPLPPRVEDDAPPAAVSIPPSAVESSNQVPSQEKDHQAAVPMELEGTQDEVGEEQKISPVLDQPQPHSSPLAPTSPSDSAATPANGTSRDGQEVEIVTEAMQVDESESGVTQIHETKSAISGVPPVVEVIDVGPEMPPPSILPDTVAEPRRATIAERRAVVLPPTSSPIATPFSGGRMRRDPAPTADSAQESTDTEMDGGLKTGDTHYNGPSSGSDGVVEQSRQTSLIAAIKAAQSKATDVDLDVVEKENQAVVPVPSARTRRSLSPSRLDEEIRLYTFPLRKQRGIANRIAITIQREQLAERKRVEAQRAEYTELQEDWKEHCRFLDDLMSKRGPPPDDLYDQPGAVPIITPGPAPVTPGILDPMDSFSGRGNRRRGVGDAVTTEAEFQEILAGLADTAAKDPAYRASKTAAVVPNMLPVKERQLRYHDDNDLVTNPLVFYDFAGTAESIWTEEERASFLRRYLSHPKQFGRIAEGIPGKSASDCVLYYYRTKKEVDYKSMLASRRGDKKKKATPIKKGGRGAALLSNLDRAKPTMNNRVVPSGSRSTAATPAREKREDSVIRSTGLKRGKPGREGGTSGRKRASLLDTPGVESEGTPSGNKGPRGLKTKRPRVSSLPKDPMAAPGPEGDDTPGREGGEDDTSILLPAPKRPGKRRKMVDPSTGAPFDPSDPINAGGALSTPDGMAPKRSSTSSYWSVEEKRRCIELSAQLGGDIKAITDALGGTKSERQVANLLARETRLDEVKRSATPSLSGADGLALPNGHGEDRERYSVPYGRNIYEVAPYGSGAGGARTAGDAHRFSEPRLGMFHDQRTAYSTPSGPAAATVGTSPVRHISRPGGMRISALLNDDASASPSESGDTKPNPPVPSAANGDDAVSDGTVSERGDMDTVRPVSRSGVPPGYAYDRRLSGSAYGRDTRPELDRFRTSQDGMYPSAGYREGMYSHARGYDGARSGYPAGDAYGHRASPYGGEFHRPAAPPRSAVSDPHVPMPRANGDWYAHSHTHAQAGHPRHVLPYPPPQPAGPPLNSGFGTLPSVQSFGRAEHARERESAERYGSAPPAPPTHLQTASAVREER